MLVHLDEREREVLRLRYGLDRGEPRTLEAVGDHFDLTRERVRQIEANLKRKIAKKLANLSPVALLEGPGAKG